MRQGRQISESKLALWRSAIAIAYADSKLADNERELIVSNLPVNALSKEQREIIDNDLANGVKLEDVFSGITDTKDRAHLINFARRLVSIDGIICEDEDSAIDYITNFHSDKLNSTVDLVAAKLQARQLNKHYENELRRENNIADFGEFFGLDDDLT